mgnify:CR=1 FL=1
MTILQTPRTIVRQATLDDAAFVIELLNEPGWIRFIGDRDIHDLDAARAYIHERLLSSYAKHGFGSYVTCEKSTNTPIGLIGFVKRDTLDAPDIGKILVLTSCMAIACPTMLHRSTCWKNLA